MQQTIHETTTAAVLGNVTKISGSATAAGAVVLGFNADEWVIIGVIGGLAFTALTFTVNWLYRHAEYKSKKNAAKR